MKTKMTFLFTFGFVLSLIAQSVTVTNTNDTGPGSFRQAITDANANSAIDSIQFNIPISDPGYNPSTGVFTIQVLNTELPGFQNSNIVVDGSSQAAFAGNTNTYVFGTGGTVGVDNLPLPALDGPEIEIIDADSLRWGLAAEAHGVQIQNLAVSGFGNRWPSINEANIRVSGGYRDLTVQECVIGSRAHMDAAPANDRNAGSNFQAYGADNGKLLNSYIAYGDAMGGFLKNNANNWTFQGNEFYSNGLVDDICDGLDIADNTQNSRVEGNLFHGNGSAGFDTYKSNGGHFVVNNTSYGNGQLSRELSGMRIYGDQADTLIKNLIYDNPGAGILVTSGAIGHVISQNSIYGNGSVAAPAASNPNRQIGIDLLAPTEDHEKGTAPFVTLNDKGDGDNGGNDLLNSPIINDVVVNGSNLVVKGFAPKNSKIEFFKGASYPNARRAQGKTYLFTATEGSPSDLDNTTGAYGPGNVNGIPAGVDSNATKFEFSVALPSAFSSGDTLTATATLPGVGTSEFGVQAEAQSGPTLAVDPNLDCIYIDVNGDIVAQFGYNNPNANPVNIPVGSNNKFVTVSNNQGQPTNFNTGVNNNQFTVTFDSTESRTWVLDGDSVTADINSLRCPVDLEVTQTASNNTPNKGDTVTFTITVKNLTPNIPATAVEIGYSIDTSLNFLSANAAYGTYDPSLHIWSLPEVVNGTPRTLTVKVKVDTTGTNVAQVLFQNQPDPVSANNSASSTVSSQGSSGGNNGGIESEGSLSQLIAQRNFDRVKSGANHFYDYIGQKPSLQDFRRNQRSKVNGIDDYLPAFGPQNSTAVITTPTDLIGITNAIDVFSADYYKPSQVRLGAILALETQYDVYNHTKIICDRLRGAQMTDLKTVTVDGHEFIMSRLDQADGSIDYSVSFVAYKKQNGNYLVNNEYVQGAYQPEPSSDILNFQVWSVSENVTKDLVLRVLNKMKGKDTVNYLNNSTPVMPTVYVKSGHYENKELVLDIVNTVGASQLTIDANKTEFETDSRSSFQTAARLDSTKTNETIRVSTGYIFDMGFSMTNNKGGGTDVLYFADGSWGRDFERGTGVQNASFSTSKEQGYTSQPDEYYLERDANFSGDVKNYFTIYRNLNVDNRPEDLSDFNQVQFEATLSGANEIVVTLVSDSIEQWQNQFRKTVTVNNGSANTHTVDFADMTSLAGGTVRNEDVLNITFSVVGDQQNFQNMSLKVKDVVFTDNGKGIGVAENAVTRPQAFTIYPNPFSDAAQIDLNLSRGGDVSIELFSLAGEKVGQRLISNLAPGNHTIDYRAPEKLKKGVYLMKVKTQEHTSTKRVIIHRK